MTLITIDLQCSGSKKRVNGLIWMYAYIGETEVQDFKLHEFSPQLYMSCDV